MITKKTQSKNNKQTKKTTGIQIHVKLNQKIYVASERTLRKPTNTLKTTI